MSDDINTLPNADERIALKAMIVEITAAYSKIDGQRQHIKDILTAAQEQFAIKKKYISKLAKVMYKNNYGDLAAENEHFESLYQTLVDNKNE